MNFFYLTISTILFMVLHSCSINTETTYYKDRTSSMKSVVNLDASIMGLMKESIEKDSISNEDKQELKSISTNWKSLYDVQKNKNAKIILNEDSARIMKKIFLKFNKNENQITGFSFKYDKLLPEEVEKFLKGKDYKKIANRQYGKWDGKTLIIDANNFSPDAILEDDSKKQTPNSTPKTKEDSIMIMSKDISNRMQSMLKMFSIDVNSTLRFQKPIISITGKHDFVKQIDNKTIQINFHSKDLLDHQKKLIHRDKTITIITE